LAVGDVNGDGKPDLVVTNDLDPVGMVSVLLGNGNGTFQAPMSFTVGNAPDGVALADFNGDGKLDLAVSNHYSGNVSVLLGNGNGTFKARRNFTTGTYPVAVAAADFNGDGKPDLAVSNYYSGTVSILLGNGNGTFLPANNLRLGTYASGLAVADVNGDGIADVLAGSGSTVTIFLGNGNGTFQSSRVAMAHYRIINLLTGDFNGDGRPDIATIDDTTVAILLGNGDGTFQAPLLYPDGAVAIALAAGPFTTNGPLDLAVANVDAGTLNLLQGNGDGTFQAAQVLGLVPNSKFALAADVNGDGRVDLVSAEAYGANVVVLLGNGNGTFGAPATFALGGYATSVAVADVNGDGKPDLITADYGNFLRAGTTVSVLLGNGNGTFQAHRDFSVVTRPRSVAVADVNGDGKLDLIVTNYGNSQVANNSVSVLLGNGDGTFQPAVNLNTGSLPFFVAVADVNGDGKSDLVVTNPAQGVTVFLGNGNGTFQAPRTFAAGLSPHVLAVADLNGDGRLDLVVTDSVAQTVNVLLGNGDGTFGAPVSLAAGAYPVFVTVADLEGDGKPDLVVGNYGSVLQDSVVTVLRGNGDGTFQSPQSYVVTSPSTSVVVADFNRDGLPDVAAFTAEDGQVCFLFGLRNTATNLQVVAPSSVALGLPFSITVHALTVDGHADAGYTGTVHFTSSDALAELPADYTFTAADEGVHTFIGVILNTAGSQTVTVTDNATSSITGIATFRVISGAVAASVGWPVAQRPALPPAAAPDAPGGRLTTQRALAAPVPDLVIRRARANRLVAPARVLPDGEYWPPALLDAYFAADPFLPQHRERNASQVSTTI
jgi:hypothetical protein